jgi:hypothetical protein
MGYGIYLCKGSGCISSFSKRATTVALSTTQAETDSLTKCIKEIATQPSYLPKPLITTHNKAISHTNLQSKITKNESASFRSSQTTRSTTSNNQCNLTYINPLLSPLDTLDWNQIGKILFELPSTSTKSLDGFTLDLVRRAYITVLQDIQQSGHLDSRFLKRYLFISKLLFPYKGKHKNRIDEIRQRAQSIIKNDWSTLTASSLMPTKPASLKSLSRNTPIQHATTLIQRGLLSKAFQYLQSTPLPPTTNTTFEQFRSLHPSPTIDEVNELPSIDYPPSFSIKDDVLYSSIHNTKKV